MKIKSSVLLLTLVACSTIYANNYTPIKAMSNANPGSVSTQGLTACEQNFSFPNINVCFDSSDGKQYPLLLEFSCTLPTDAKNVPTWMTKTCTGKMQTYNPGTSDYVEVQVVDDHNPQRMKTNHIHIQMGLCSADFTGDLTSMAGKIYSCNQATGKFEIKNK